MNLNLEPIKYWFGFDRRERRASFILLLIVIIVLAVRTIIPEKNMEIEDITSSIPVEKLSLQETINEANGFKKVIPARHRPFTAVKRDTINKARVLYSKPEKARIDLNNCDTALLKTLPGIGNILSVRIIKYRTLLGGYASVNQLKEVYGLTAETFDLIKSKVSADSSIVHRIRINSAGYKELSRLPYFKNYEVTAILKYRELKGRINGISDLEDNKLITKEKAIKVGPYLDFE